MTLGFVGYQKLRPGRIHLFCPKCKRKMSNVKRDKMDPPRAALAQVFCERCSVGCKDSGQTFLDARGRQLCSYCGRSACERAEGQQKCDERLIRRLER